MVGNNPITKGIKPPLNVLKFTGILAISSSIQATEAVHLPASTNIDLEPSNLLQLASSVQSHSSLGQASEANLDAESKLQAQWGFLKNIVNIDTFFASGAHSSGSRADTGAHRRQSLASQLSALDAVPKEVKAKTQAKSAPTSSAKAEAKAK